MSDYYTHRPFLIKELEKIDFSKPVNCLEFGTGDGSALVFNEFAKKHPNLFIKSYDNDKNWLYSTKEKYGLLNYEFNYVDNWSDLLKDSNFEKSIYDIVFVDQAPWEARIGTIELLKNKAKIIILHDYDFFNTGKCQNVYSVGEESFFRKLFDIKYHLYGNYDTLPPTLVIKNDILF